MPTSGMRAPSALIAAAEWPPPRDIFPYTNSFVYGARRPGLRPARTDSMHPSSHALPNAHRRPAIAAWHPEQAGTSAAGRGGACKAPCSEPQRATMPPLQTLHPSHSRLALQLRHYTHNIRIENTEHRMHFRHLAAPRAMCTPSRLAALGGAAQRLAVAAVGTLLAVAALAVGAAQRPSPLAGAVAAALAAAAAPHVRHAAAQ